MTEELRIYKLCSTNDNDYSCCYVDELGWINETEFCVWVSYLYLKEFIGELKNIFGNVIFDDGGFDANMQENGVCIDLCQAIGSCIDIETVFPKNKYKH